MALLITQNTGYGIRNKKQRSRQVGYLLSVILFFLIAVYFLLLAVVSVHAARVKEVAGFEGIRPNHLIGYGLVVGLDGTGDKTGTEFTIQSLVNMLNRFGVQVDPQAVKVKNVAAAVITAELSPFSRPGARIDVLVSSIGDAKSLQGGTLLFTPLKGADGNVYVIAQGPVSIGGFLGGGEISSVQKNHLTAGRIPGGGVVEKEIPLDFGKEVFILLKQTDFTTSSKIAGKINSVFEEEIAKALDGTKVKVVIPESYKNRRVDFLAEVEGLDVSVDNVSRVVVNERTGTIVIGDKVRISTVAVSQGNLTVEVKTTYRVAQPSPFGQGETVVQPEEEVKVEEEEARLLLLEQGTSLGDLVDVLNTLGVTPRDLIAILQAIKAAGALQAELKVI